MGGGKGPVVGLLLLLLLHAGRSEAGLSYTVQPPTRDQCLYVSDFRGIAQVFSVDPTQAALVEASLATSNTTNLIDKGDLVQILEDIGYGAGGMAIYNDILYVASLRIIAQYNISNNLERLDNFVELAFVPFACLPDGLVAANEVLYLTCGAFVGGFNVTYPILKFSLSAPDYGSFLNATDYPSYTTGYLFFYQAASVTGSFLVSDYFGYRYTYETVTGEFLLMSGADSLAMVPITNATKYGPVSNQLYTWTYDDLFGLPNTTVPEGNITNEYWYSFTWGEDGNFYMVRQYDYSGVPVGDVIAFDGTTGYFIFSLTGPRPELAGAVGIALAPTGDFLVAAYLTTAPSHIYVYDKVTGANKGAFVSGTTQDDILPAELMWGPCPTVPPASSSTDNTLTIVLATVLPILALPTCCILIIILALIIYLLAKEINDRRRHTYYVSDEDGMEMGKRGTGEFTYREIDPDELEIGDLLGEGAYGKVYKGTFRGAAVAIKTFDQIKLDEADEEMLQDIKEEAQMMERLGNHPNVINFVGAITSPSTKGHSLHFSLVTEYCPNGSLFDFLIKKKSKVPFIILIKMARDIAAGILHLHKEKVIHRDIATRNILVGDNYAVYLSDFGMARIKQQEVNTTVANIGPIKWMAPECMTHKQYSEASDTFAYGVLLWEMVTRKIPWKGMDPAQIIIAVAEKNTRLEVPAETDPILKKIIKSVWRSAPDKRMSMAEIVAKLDSYHKSLQEVYEDMSSSEDEGYTDRSYFKNTSADRTSKAQLIGAGSREKHSTSNENESTGDLSSNYSTMSGFTDSMASATPFSPKAGKEKGKKKVKDSEEKTSTDDYGSLSSIQRGKEEDYGVIPEQEKNYGDIPDHLHSNYGDVGAAKKTKNLL